MTRNGLSTARLPQRQPLHLAPHNDSVVPPDGNDDVVSPDSNAGVVLPDNNDHQKVITNVDDVDRDNNNLEVQTQVPAQTRREPIYLELLLGDKDFELPPYINDEETNHYSSPTWIDQEPATSNDVIETAELEPQEQITSAGASSQFLVPLLAEVHQDSSQITRLNNDHLGVGGEKIKDPTENNSIRLINIMGYVAVLSADPFGSRFIQ
ncbi:hypothetical protein GUJ93_ZPchr0008g12463 [Zizania palustris]|uniref:Uncharacterized protein n=1 Tax=Zizania palustris TaxID=103762 RepID=A0A8J5RW36_ZIZPA|nr:hypothetical protein GUJ93_ZPchr0008g12463 [Zizania palustris]